MQMETGGPGLGNGAICRIMWNRTGRSDMGEGPYDLQLAAGEDDAVPQSSTDALLALIPAIDRD